MKGRSATFIQGIAMTTMFARALCVVLTAIGIVLEVGVSIQAQWEP
jgi:hypothetical protein